MQSEKSGACFVLLAAIQNAYVTCDTEEFTVLVFNAPMIKAKEGRESVEENKRMKHSSHIINSSATMTLRTGFLGPCFQQCYQPAYSAHCILTNHAFCRSYCLQYI